MLRKDVKLGFAIGGIMLAVVIVYVMVVPGGDKKAVTVANDDSQGKADVSPSPVPSDSKSAEPETATSSNAPPADPSKASPDQPAANNPPVGQSGSQANGQTNNQPAVPSGNQSTTPPAAGGNQSGGGADWNRLLAQGSSSPTMMSETPTLDNKHTDAGHSDAGGSAAGADSSANASSGSSTVAPEKTSTDQAVAGNSSAAAIDKAVPDLSIDTGNTPATQPSESGQRTHVVQSGEMLTSIAAAAYGDSRKWKRIAEANPNVNPNNMVVGAKLVIPTLKSSSNEATLAGATIPANLDPQTQYAVQPNDSLYRISMKLYGKADHVDKLYDANKDLIGSDPKRLKLNMVLKLTDPPTSTLTNTASR